MAKRTVKTLVEQEALEIFRRLLFIADEYSDAMKKIGYGHSELGADAPSMSISGLAKGIIKRMDQR